MSEQIHLTISGNDVRPDTVALSDLIDILRSFNAALSATAQSHGTDDVAVTLTGIAEGSNVLNLSVNRAGRSAAVSVINAIDSQDDRALPLRARNCVREIWKRAKSRGWDGVEIACPASNIGALATASISRLVEPFVVPIATGRTSLLAYVTHIGGEPKATVKFHGGSERNFTAKVQSPSLAESIPLYRHVELHGTAQWDTRDWSLYHFTVDQIGPYQQEKSAPASALESLAELSGGVWNNIDPTQFVDDLRGD